jgi:L-ascorbate metabolism protein UlaG (beta-lactamase superfamily)
MLLERRTPWPKHVDTPQVTLPSLGDASALVTFIGHSTFLIQTPAGNILTDPVYSRCAGPFGRFGPRRVRPPAIVFDDLPPIATVLLSHNHYDHCDLNALSKLSTRFDPLVITPLGNGRFARSAGIRRVEELDWWEQVDTPGASFVATPAHHFSARTPFDKNRALWSGFTITTSALRIYFAGDSAYATLFREIRARCGPLDLALLPIGAYEPRWFMKIVHMNPEEAVQAHLDLEARTSVAMHFGTFQLTTEGMDEPERALQEACRAKGVSASAFRVPQFGESIRLS